MRKSYGMPQLVNRLLEKAVAKERTILRQTIKRLPRTRQSDKQFFVDPKSSGHDLNDSTEKRSTVRKGSVYVGDLFLGRHPILIRIS
jgi:hypothetical protein